MKWWQIKKRDADLERELRSDLELEEEEQREKGKSPEEARYAAQRAFGNATLIREQTREAWGWTPFERLWQDVRYAFRQLRRSPGFALATILILALGIGAVTAVFSLIDTALLKMLPVRDPEQLVELRAINPAFDVNNNFSYPAFKSFENQTQVLAGALAFRKLSDIDVEMEGHSELAQGQVVSGDYFSVLGVRAILGRTILSTDETGPGQDPVAVTQCSASSRKIPTQSTREIERRLRRIANATRIYSNAQKLTEPVDPGKQAPLLVTTDARSS